MATRGTGFTMVELMIAVAIMAVAILTLLSVLPASSVARIAAEEESIAVNALKNKLAEARSKPLASLYSYYTTGSWVFTHRGVSQNYTNRFFAIQGLEPVVVGSGYLPQGEVIVVADEGPNERDARFASELSLGADLNGDGRLGGIDLNGNGSDSDNPAYSLDLDASGTAGDNHDLSGGGYSAIQVVAVARWQSRATKRPVEKILRTLIGERPR